MSKTKRFKFSLGEKARDTISGFEGTITGRTEYLNGCVRYALLATVEKPHEEPKELYFDEEQLESIGKAKRRESAPSGGPRPTPRRTGT